MYGWTRQTKEAFSDGFDRGTGIMIAKICVAMNEGLIKIETPEGVGLKALFKAFKKLDEEKINEYFDGMVKSRLGIQ